MCTLQRVITRIMQSYHRLATTLQGCCNLEISIMGCILCKVQNIMYSISKMYHLNTHMICNAQADKRFCPLIACMCMLCVSTNEMKPFHFLYKVVNDPYKEPDTGQVLYVGHIYEKLQYKLEWALVWLLLWFRTLS